jgi:hypothetical protein
MHATSNSGWTSDTLGLKWLEHCFIPKTRRNDGKRILLLIDDCSSHLTSKSIAQCIEASIDLTNLPPHTSHRSQPLDIGIFGPLKGTQQNTSKEAYETIHVELNAWNG